MLETYLFASNIILMTVCALFALVFINLPLPKDNSLNTYKVTLRVLSICYGAVSVFMILDITSGITSTDYLSSDFLAISSSQATLFTLSLNNLFNPQKITFKYIFKQCVPLIIFLLLHAVLVPLFGYHFILNNQDWLQNMFHPTVLLRELFLFFYIWQFFFYIRLFFSEEKKYHKQLDDYCADTADFQLSWVRYGFFAAIFAGSFAILTTIFAGTLTSILFNIFLIVFYTFFALRFMQYPWIFQHIGAIFENIETGKEHTPESQSIKQKQSNWLELKKRIVSEKCI